MSNIRPHDPKSPSTAAAGGGPTGPTGPVPPTAPVLDNLNPATAVVGGPDVTLEVNGSGFTADSRIYFNGGEEPTTLVSPTQVTTIVKPSTASGPWTVPVDVRNGGAASNALSFSFTEAVAAPL